MEMEEGDEEKHAIEYLIYLCVKRKAKRRG